jgi:hypothetical protein
MQNDGSGQITLPSPIKINYSTLPTLVAGQIGHTQTIKLANSFALVNMKDGINSNQKTIVSVSLTPGVYFITGQTSLQTTQALANTIRRVLISFSNNQSASATQNANILTPLVSRHTSTNFATSNGWDVGIYRETICQTVSIVNTTTIYFNIGVNSENPPHQADNQTQETTITVLEGKLIATRIA